MNPLVVKKVQRRPFEAVTSSRTPFLHSLELVYRKVPQFVLKAVLPCKAYAWSSFFRLNTNTREKKCWSTSHKHWSATQLSGNGKKADLNGSRGSFTVTTQTEKAHWIKYIQTESRMRGACIYFSRIAEWIHFLGLTSMIQQTEMWHFNSYTHTPFHINLLVKTLRR